MKNLSLKWMVIGQGLVIALVITGVSFQVRLVKEKTIAMADLKDPSPFTNILTNQMSQVNVGLLTYLHNQDSLASAQITQAETLFEESISRFQKENPRMLPAEAQTKILEAFAPFKDAARDLQTQSDAQNRQWADLLKSQDELMNRLEFRVRPLVRHTQPMAQVRLDVITSLETEVRNVPEIVARALLDRASAPMETNRYAQRVDKFFSIYAPMAKAPAERRDLQAAHESWDHINGIATDLISLEARKTESFRRFGQAYDTLQRTISLVLPPVAPEIIQQKKDGLLHAIQWMIGGAAFLLLAGVGSCLVTGLWMYRRIHEALKEIQAVTEAAVKGDLSREAASGSRSLDPMAHSVNRLIGVMRRSEQLILQLGNIVESSGDASVGLTLDGSMLSWNRGAQRIYGYSLDEIKGKSVEMLFPSNRGVQFTEMLMSLHEKRVASLETIHLRRSGVPINVRLIMTHILDANGNPIGLSLLARDLGLSANQTSNSSSVRNAA